VVAIIISSAFSYYANVKFVFKQNPNLKSFGSFYISICISIFANTIVLHNLINFVKLEPILAKVMTTTLLLPLNFAISQRIFVRDP
jgi:putative flippase GtrA